MSLGSNASLGSSVVQRGVAAQWRRDKIRGSKCKVSRILFFTSSPNMEKYACALLINHKEMHTHSE